MNYKSFYIKERLLEIITKGNIIDINNIKSHYVEIEREIPSIKNHHISGHWHGDNDVIIEFWYYIDNTLKKDSLELDIKSVYRNARLNLILS